MRKEIGKIVGFGLLAAACLGAGPALSETARKVDTVWREPDTIHRAPSRYELALERRDRARFMRDSARKTDNFLVAFVLSGSSYESSSPGYYYASSSHTLFGLNLGYRTHFTRVFGLEADVRLLGSDLSAGFFECGGGCDDAWVLSGAGKLILGPFGRFVLKPYAGYSYGGVRREEYYSVTGTYRPRSFPVRSVDLGLGMGLFFGSKDRFSLMASAHTGMGENSLSGGELEFAYAFQLPKTDAGP